MKTDRKPKNLSVRPETPPSFMRPRPVTNETEMNKEPMTARDEILVVDDAPVVRTLLTDILSAEGFQVRSVDTGERALRSVASEPPKLILLDIDMPGMDGFEVCRRLKAQEESRGIPVIFISGITGVAEKVKGFGLGAVDFIPKPFLLEELLLRVRTHLELSRLRTRLEDQVNLQTAELRKSAERYRTILETIEDAYYETDLAGNLTYINDAMIRISGRSRAELLRMSFRDYTDAATAQRLKQVYSQVYRTGEPCKGIEHEVITKNGIKKNLEASVSLIRDESGKPIGFRGITRDITQLRRTEKALLNSEERFRVVAESISDFIFEENFKTGQLEWFGKAIERLRDLFGEIPDTETAYEKLIHPEDHDRIVGAIKRHMRNREPFREEYRLIGEDGKILYFLSQGICLWDENGKPYKWVGALSDITERKNREEELKESVEKLHKAMGGIVQAMSMAVETRDPYTAGHQCRVANLARSIGQEMGLTKDQIEAIRMAGTVHDLGKISLPAEILSKPTQLSELEFGLIKVHPQTSYDILKDIDFPWPIAQIVFQHHERIDGSGYPSGLKDQEILLEAKVLMVADVVEAIASHRPYRAAYGIEVALNEITKNKGILYDSGVVDACLRLFREKGFTLE